MHIALGILFCIVCLLLILIVLLQRGRGGGLAGAFGGAGGHSAFGAKTGDIFTWVTVVLTALFLIVAVVNNYAWKPAEWGTSTDNPVDMSSPIEGTPEVPDGSPVDSPLPTDAETPPPAASQPSPE